MRRRSPARTGDPFQSNYSFRPAGLGGSSCGLISYPRESSLSVCWRAPATPSATDAYPYKMDLKFTMALPSSVCFNCVKEPYLEAWIKGAGALSCCALCSDQNPCVPLTEIVVHALTILERYIWETSNHRISASDGSRLESPGEPLEYWVSKIFCCRSDEPIVEVLCNEFEGECFGELTFPRGVIYSVRPPEFGCAMDKWCDIQESMRHASRFFNDDARQLFSWLFDSLDQYPISPAESAVVKSLSPYDCPPIYRARTCSTSTTDEISRDPGKGLGAPPKDVSGEGRMSPAGIPAFYGAFDRKTCLAELRPPVGGTVISGEFRLTREVRVLDFDQFESADLMSPPSFFDPEYFERVDRHDFLRKIHEEISRPVLPGAGRDYLITQAIAEYLATQCRPRFDGVIFESAQFPPGRNIVLFSHVACKPTSSTVKFGRGYRVMGSKVSEALSIEYVGGSLIFHNIGPVYFGTTDEPLADENVAAPVCSDESVGLR